jgi:hypothetical protein
MSPSMRDCIHRSIELPARVCCVPHLSYVGFHRDKSVPAAQRARTADALEKMRASGLFHYDHVVYNNRVSSTLVQRTLVGT